MQFDEKNGLEISSKNSIFLWFSTRTLRSIICNPCGLVPKEIMHQYEVFYGGLDLHFAISVAERVSYGLCDQRHLPSAENGANPQGT